MVEVPPGSFQCTCRKQESTVFEMGDRVTERRYGKKGMVVAVPDPGYLDVYVPVKKCIMSWPVEDTETAVPLDEGKEA